MTSRDTYLTVAEWFGPTVQGEGPSCGQLAFFVRLSGCNLACTWCDTPYTWDWQRFDKREEQHRVSIEELHRLAKNQSARLVVITGGEPLRQHRGTAALSAALVASGCRVEIETNGTITPPTELVKAGVVFNVSPKLAHSQQPARRINAAALERFASSGQAVFKFVAQTSADLDEVEAIVSRYGCDPVWIMPEGTTPTVTHQRMAELADDVIARGWNLTPRLHIDVWGDRRGR